MNDSICIDYIEIIAGTSNTVSKAYTEAVRNSDLKNVKGIGYIKNFLSSIEKVSPTNLKDDKIRKSAGNIDRFRGNDSIVYALEYLRKELNENKTVVELTIMYNALKRNKRLYIAGYDKEVRLVQLEYETSLYLLISGITYIMAYNLSLTEKGITKKADTVKKGSFPKIIRSMAKELDSQIHSRYLYDMISAKDRKPIRKGIMTESVILDTIDLIDSILTNIGKVGTFVKSTFTTFKRSIFGIIPLIRTVLYVQYKDKADNILSLEQQIEYIKQNIEFLGNNKSIDPAKKALIVKKQEAIVQAYTKRAAKLRAELSENEREAAQAINDDNKEVKKEPDDDFVLEYGEMEKIRSLGSDPDE
jgi:hypothetical protein